MSDELIGKRFGNYEITELVGRGGMASVYRAFQLSMNRTVALKVLPKQFLNDDNYMQRFNREVQIVSQLEHRSIVPVHDYGEEDQQPYIVMRYMSGGSLDDMLKTGPLTAEQMVDILAQIGPALDYAHSKNVLHRDLKPSNVLLDDNGGAFLTDFGIARILGETSGTITTQGVVGTPAYMSPEQAQGQPLDNRSDLYSLGIMMFELMTGRRPFDADTPYGVAVQQVTTAPPSPRSFNEMISPAFEQVILRLLNKNREDRYPDAATLLSAAQSAVKQPNLHDTQPGIRPPKITSDITAPITPPDVFIQPIAAVNQPIQTPPPYTPSPSTPPPYTGQSVHSSQPVMPVVQEERKANLFLNLLVGGGLGCGLLVLIVGLGWLGINALTEYQNRIAADETAAVTETATEVGTRTSIPRSTLDPTSQAAMNERLGTGTPDLTNPTATEFTQLGTRPLPTLLPEFRGLNDSLIYVAELDGNIDIYRRSLLANTINRLTTHEAMDTAPSASPDGNWIAFISNRSGQWNLFMMSNIGGGVTQLTDNDVPNLAPVWSPDGEWIVYTSDTNGDDSFDLYRIRPDGTDQTLIYASDERISCPNFNEQGDLILFSIGTPNNAQSWRLAQVDVEGNRFEYLTASGSRGLCPSSLPEGRIVYQSDGEGYASLVVREADGTTSILWDEIGYETFPRPSSNGEFIVFSSDQSGRDQLYLLDLATNTIQQITTEGGYGAAWMAR